MLYLDLFRSLTAHDIPYLLVGGLAVNLHGIPRMTMDVDLAVKFTKQSVSGLEAMCRELSLVPVQPVSVRQLADPAHRERLRHEKNMAAFSLRPPAAADPTVFPIPWNAFTIGKTAFPWNGVMIEFAKLVTEKSKK